MKQYPKVARHDLPFVPLELFDATDLHLLEKLDGGNFRFMLYEERFADEYADIVHEQQPSDGDIIFGTKRVVRGRVDEPVETYDSDFQPGMLALRDVDKEAIRAAQDEYGPLVWFAEHMIPHTLNYDYEDDPPPALIGFDVYAQRQDDRSPSDLPENPYKERHVGYLDIDEARQCFDNIGIPFTPIVKEPSEIRGSFDPDSFEVPQSAYADVDAEGVVIRSDNLNVRAKLVTDEFRELHRASMGGQAANADGPVEWIIDALVTPARVRKHARRLVVDEGYQFTTDESFVDAVTQAVLADAWTEEFVEIAELEESFAPADVHEPAQERVGHVIERMKQMAARTDSDPTTAWTSIDNGRAAAPQPTDKNDAVARVDHVAGRRAQEDDTSPEEALFDELVGYERVDSELDRLIEEENRELAGWAVSATVDRLVDTFWVSETSRAVLWRLHVDFTPSEIEPTIRSVVRDRIEERADVDLDAGGKGWNPDADEASADEFGEFF